MTEIVTIDRFGRWGTSVFSENTAIFFFFFFLLFCINIFYQSGALLLECTVFTNMKLASTK